jgi:glycosidase
MSLLLPGTPIVYYGDELGMGDLMESWKPWLPEQPMRGLMQWDNSTTGGFQGNCTSCRSSPWIDVNSDYTTINVEVCDLS